MFLKKKGKFDYFKIFASEYFAWVPAQKRLMLKLIEDTWSVMIIAGIVSIFLKKNLYVCKDVKFNNIVLQALLKMDIKNMQILWMKLVVKLMRILMLMKQSI